MVPTSPHLEQLSLLLREIFAGRDVAPVTINTTTILLMTLLIISVVRSPAGK